MSRSFDDPGAALRGRRISRLVVRCYPRTFRERYGHELADFLARQRAESRYGRGLGGGIRYWREVWWDAVSTGLRMRFRGLGARLGVGPENREPKGRSPGPAGNGRREGRPTMNVLLQDLKFALRTLAGAPAYTAVAVATLAVGIGANAAIFSVVNGVLLRPLPYEDPGALYSVATDADGGSSGSWPDVSDWMGRTDLFDGVAAAIEFGSDVQWDGEAEQLQGGSLTAGTLAALGVRPIVGRGFTAEEDAYGGPRAVLLSEGLWQRRFGGDPAVAGRSIQIGGNPHTIVGVLPAGFAFPEPGLAFWTALREGEIIEEAGFNRMSRTIGFIPAAVRLRHDVAPSLATSTLNTLARQVREDEGVAADPPVLSLRPLHERVVGDVRGMMLLVFASVGLVLVVASANLAGLALTRTTVRERELAVRTALGASRGRLVSQLLTESAVLAVAGGALGLLLALGLTDLLVRLAPPGLPRLDEVSVDASVLLFTLLLSAVTGIATGLIPALRSSRPDLQSSLKEGGRGNASGRNRLQQGLVVAQVALAVALVTGAALLLNSFSRLLSVDPGFEPENLMRVGLTLPSGERYEESAATISFYDQVLERVRALPGVVAASATYSPPMGQSDFRQSIRVDGVEADPEEPEWVGTVIVQSDYFGTAGIELLQGRLFDERDGSGDPLVAVVNDAMARRLWPGQDPLGKRFAFGDGISGSIDRMSREYFPEDWLTVVGVVEDVRRSSLSEEPVPEFYRPHAQMGWGGLALMVRTDGDPAALAASVRQAVWEVDAGVAVDEALTMGQVISRSVATPRFRTLLMGGFALIACVLAMVGVYAIMAFTVARQTREIGIRIALGAPVGRVRRDVLTRGLGLSVLGLVAGLAVAAAGTRVLRTMLFQVSPTDPVTFVAVAAGVTAVAALACWLPALRASRVDPVQSIQVE